MKKTAKQKEFVAALRALQESLRPFAEAHGIKTDEDVFELLNSDHNPKKCKKCENLALRADSSLKDWPKTDML